MPGPRPIIRPASPLDAPELRDLLVAVAAEPALAPDHALTLATPAETARESEALPDRIALALASPHDLWLVAQLGPADPEQGAGPIVGHVRLRAGRRQRTRHTASLWLAVAAPHRRLGIGRALLNAALADAPARGLERITLAVASTNAAALALYRDAGFILEGRRARQIRLAPGRYADEILMARTLPA